MWKGLSPQEGNANRRRSTGSPHYYRAEDDRAPFINTLLPAAMILAALQQAGFVDVQHSLRGACLSEYVARKPT